MTGLEYLLEMFWKNAKSCETARYPAFPDSMESSCARRSSLSRNRSWTSTN